MGNIFPLRSGLSRGAGRRTIALATAALTLSLFAGALSSADAASVSLRQQGTGLTEIAATIGQVVDLELVIDTAGLTFEGYFVGIDFVGGGVDNMSVVHASLPPMSPDLFGVPVIDNAAGTIRDLNQFSFVGSLAAGTYVVDVISLEVTALGIVATPGLFGETLGLEDGSCPGTVVGCTVSFGSASIVPEPSLMALLGLGLGGLGLLRRVRATG